MLRIARVAILALAALIGLAGWKGIEALLRPTPVPGISRHLGEKPMTPKVVKTDEEWKETLTPGQYRVMRQCGTEPPFSGKYDNHYEKGTYVCAACGTPLFASGTKYDHGTGWPSFTAPVEGDTVEFREDQSFLMRRIEARCASCGAHLGHVFNDGPAPTFDHYCINSEALNFVPETDEAPVVGEGSKSSPEKAGAGFPSPGPTKPGTGAGLPSPDHSKIGAGLPSPDLPKIGTTLKLETATFAAGCFWGVEYKFRQVNGVEDAVVGYTGGATKNPTYAQVCTDRTGHAEAVQVTFDPGVVGYEELVRYFFKIHEPTEIDRQGPDVGTQYRSVIFTHGEDQKKIALKVIAELNASGAYSKPIATGVVPAGGFTKAEEYHQRYYEKHNKKACRF